MNKADFVTELTVTDPDTGESVEIAIYKDRESSGMFGVDSSYILTLSDDDPVNNPFNGDEIELVETAKRAGIMVGELTARRALESDDALELYIVEIGLIDRADDPLTVFETVSVMVACYDSSGAGSVAVDHCEEQFPVATTVDFISMDTGTKVED